MQNISYLVVVKYLAILTGIYDFLNYSIVLLYYMYYNTSRTLNKSVNEESEIFDAIVTHESSDTTTTFAKKTNFTSTIVYCWW